MPTTRPEWAPFHDAPWDPKQKEQFDLIVAWHDALAQLPQVAQEGDASIAILDTEADRIAGKETGTLIPPALSRRVFEQKSLPLAWFAIQVRAAHHFYQPIQFEDGHALKAFLTQWAIPHGYLIAHLADAAHRWQLPQVSELASAFFLADKLVHLTRELDRDRLYIPLSDLAQAGVSVDDLKRGNNSPAMKKLLWKQVVRIRDAFAQGQPLVKELPRNFRRSFKKNWLTGLEMVNEIERRKYDLWSAPIELSATQRFQINVLSVIGKGARQARGR